MNIGVKSIKQAKALALILIVMPVLFQPLAISQSNVWTKINTVQQKKSKLEIALTSKGKVSYQSLDVKSLDVLLHGLEYNHPQKQSSITLEIPLPTGEFKEFTILKDDLIPEALEKKYPQLRAYKGYTSKEANEYLRFTKTDQGYDFTIFSSESGITRVLSYDGRTYESLYKKDVDYPEDTAHFNCSAGEAEPFTPELTNVPSNAKKALQDNFLRTYDIAIAATGEYTQSYGGTISGALSGIVASLSNVTGYFEMEHSISFRLAGNNNNIIFTNPATDPYVSTDLVQMVDANRQVLNQRIGPANYDIGHVLGTQNLGGYAYVGVACINSHKAGGVSSMPITIGKLFDIDLLGHELGHQFGATHTFNNSCGGSRVASSAFEPGSGTTTLSYAGLCAPNVESTRDTYFHGHNVSQINQYVTNGAGRICPNLEDLGNESPTVDAGQDYTIPASTPFTLSASATDDNFDFLTFCWEQIDCIDQSYYSDDLTEIEGPLFRSLVPSGSLQRHFPQSEVLHNDAIDQWEQLPVLTRDLNFLVTARDNRSGNGLTAQDNMKVSVDGNSGPFTVLYPTETETWISDENRVIRWDVANTNVAPVSCSEVDILLSLDGGRSYSRTLADNVPNDGEYTINVPNLETTQARIKVICSDNIFYDVSKSNITIEKEEICTDLAPVMTLAPSIVMGKSDVYVVVKVSEIANLPSDGTVRVTIPYDPRFTFLYNNGLTSLGFSSLDNADWVYMGHNGLYHTFRANKSITLAGSTFGFVGSFDPQNSDGTTTITCTLRPFDGGECNVANNSDSEYIDFFK